MNTIEGKSYPLSFGQQAMWFIYQMDPESVAYNIFITVKIETPVNLPVFVRAWNRIFERHPILRTTYTTTSEGQPIQQIHEKPGLSLKVIDAQGWSEDELKERILTETDRPFNLEKDSILRINLFTRAAKEHILLLTMHHIAGDMWSFDLLLSEFQNLYTTEIELVNLEQTEIVKDCSTQYPSYGDFVNRQSEMLSDSRGQKAWQYWQQQLAGELPILNLPTDKPRPMLQTYQGESYLVKLDQALIQKLRNLALIFGTTLYKLLLTAFYIQIYRYTNQTDILIGSPMRGRWGGDFKKIVGYFVNLIPLRISLSENATFTDLLTQVNETVKNAQKYQDYPFSILVEKLQPQRDIGFAPLCQVSFTWQQHRWCEGKRNSLYSQEKELQMQPYLLGHQRGADRDLNLMVMEAEGVLQLCWQYNTSLFNPDTITRVAGHFVTLLEGIVANPQERSIQLPLLTQSERHQLLVEWNNTKSEYPKDKCIHQLFEKQVELTPDAVAVVFEQQQLTYQQLNTRANQLAHYLQSLGVKPEVLVGICVKRSVEMVTGLLAILKAGGAYVPLDPNYPTERLSYMLNDSGVEVLLTQQELLSSLPSSTAQVVCLDRDCELIEQQSQANLESGVSSENLAYVIYTSGSTGKPKGVLVEHKNAVRLFAATQSWYNFNENDVWTNFHSIAFDFSVWEIWGALIYGGRLVIVPYWISREPETFHNLLCCEKVTVLNQTPSAFRQLIPVEESHNKQSKLSLRLVIFGGEALEVQSLKPWFERHGEENPLLVNMYGITETTVHVTYRPLAINDLNSTSSVIGRPIPDLEMYILDENLQPVPIRITGQMYVGGHGLTRGYLNRPELTTERFISNPFGVGHLYKTGDLARYLPDGNIEFVGRLDNQVKIRGFRIELGEIEAALNNHPQVQLAVVIVREDIPGNKRLVAYVVAGDQSLNNNQLRGDLKQKLPEYMVPSAFVLLESLPLTPNGKIDRKALPSPDWDIARDEYIAPRTEVEVILSQIWQELLLKEKVGIHDNFFNLGGDSILSIQVVSRAKNSGILITPRQIFQNQTITKLARVANTTLGVNAQQGIVTGAAPLTPIQQWFFSQNYLEPHHYNQSFLLRVPQSLSSERLAIAVKKLLLHHDALRLRFTSQGAEYRPINHQEDQIPLSLVDLSSTPVQEQAQALEKIATEYQASLNLSTGPIIRVVMFNLGQDESRLLVIIHHLAVDAVSWRIITSDLATIYQQIEAQQPIKLSAKTTAFKDWAVKLNKYAQSETLKQELDYWLNQPWFQNQPLPIDYHDTQSDNMVASAQHVSRKLSMEDTSILLGSVNSAYNTQINDILLSALVTVLAEWTENVAILIDLEGHGREDIFEDVDLSRTVGWFTSLFPVLLKMPEINQPAELIKSIKEQLRAIPKRGIGYGILRYLCEETTIQEQIRRIPKAEISFNYLGQFDQVQVENGWLLNIELTGANQSPRQNRVHLLDINALVIEGELQINWTYSSQVHNRATVENLAQNYIQTIRILIEHCQSDEAFGYTPSDFPDAKLNQEKLDELLVILKNPKIESIYPLSPTQQGILFHSIYAPNSGVYFEQMTLTLKGDVNEAALEHAWQKVVNRHSILRTLFVWENRLTPLQIVLKQVTLPWSHLDWSSLSPTEQQQQFQELLLRERKQGFVFNEAPLMRCTLIKLSDETYKFVWNHHHTLIDGWSLPILFKEVSSFYQAERTGETCYLPAPVPYGDYITWLNSQNTEVAFEFWQQNLQGFSAPTPLVVDKTKSLHEQTDSHYSEVELRLGVEVTRGLQNVANHNDLTLPTIVQGAWALLLSRYSGEENVVFGVTVSGRTANLSGIEKMVGLFINTLPLLVEIAPSENLIIWLQQIQQSMLKVQDYSYTPLFEIQARSEVPGGIPLFESIVVFENYPIEKTGFNEKGLLQLSEIKGFEQTNYPLTVVAMPGDELLIKISYDTLRFEESTMERMLGHLQTLFSAIAANPQQTVAELPLLTPAERHQLLVEWNNNQSEYPKEKCIHQLFEEQVELTPHAVAVVFEQQQLTYQQLNTQANQLAHHLQSLGVKPEVLVGICLERSVEMIVGLLGILKAGGAYVPLDPHYPAERLSYMLDDSGVELLLTQQELLSSLPSSTAQVVCLDRDWGMIEQQSHSNLSTGMGSDNLAYVIYTSGSTGQPKGTCVIHRGVVRLVKGNSYAQLNQTQVFVQLAPVSFDASTFEIWGSLLNGAKLVLFPSEQPSLQELGQALKQHQIQTLWLTAGLFHLMVDERLEDLKSLSQLLAGGDVLSVQHVEKVLSNLKNCQLINGYGPTENTTFTCCYPITQTQQPLSSVPIGRAIANTQVYLLDPHLQLVPIGVIGEIYTGGDGLARGYHNRPELTHEKFIPNPFNPSQSPRLYRTGDLGRYLADGNIEFVGRFDNQVKIRGFRIELGEIEAALSNHPQIQQAVVIVREDIPENKRLVAYVVAGDQSLNNNQLRGDLKQKLPEYMVPSAFVLLETLPLTPNGKIDRKALPSPDWDTAPTEEYIAPKTQSEQIIANIFAKILGRTVVGTEENFFNLGGHSLLATQLISRLKETFQIEIPLRTVFESPTVAQLEPTITQLRTLGAGLNVPSIQPIAKENEILPLSFAQERLWFLNQLEGSSATYNIPAAIRLVGNLELNALQLALREIVRRHEILRTSFPTVNGKPRQIVNPETTLNIKVIDLQELETTQREKVVGLQLIEEASNPFVLEVSPLIRCSLLQISATEYVLLLTMHHIVSDGWSMGIFIQELSDLYQAFCAVTPSPLAELSIQYADFAVWQRQWLSGEILATQLDYWKQQLQGAPELLQLPTDRTRPSVQTYIGKTHRFSLNEDLTQKLHKLSRESNTTLFMTLLAAIQTLLYRYSGQTDILIGSPIANRHHREIESLIGFFVNTLVLRSQFEDNPSFEQLLKQVRETTLRAYEHQDVPFEVVVEALKPARSLSHSPLFQVMFVLQNIPMVSLELPGLTWSQLEQDFPIAKFDLTLSISETFQGLEGGWEYNTDLFDDSTIERMATHFENLLSAIVAHPQQTVAQLPLLSEAERHQLLVEWNNTHSEYPKDKCIHQLFESQVEQTPDAVAVVYEQQQLTYQQLNTQANQLGHYLQSLGVRPEVLVGICVERSVEMVVGLLGILKAGGAYLPLDPNYPAERLSYMLDDSGVELLLTQQELLSSLPSSTAQVVCLDRDWGMIEQQSHSNLSTGTGSDNLAYVIYTSGSTGQPKGTCVIHRGVVRLVKGNNYAQLNQTQVFVQLAPVSFDASTFEIWGSLLNGAKLVLFPSEQPSLQELGQALKQHQIQTLWLTAGLFHLMVDERLEDLKSLSQLLAGGDVLSVQHVEKVLSNLKNCQLINGYGPTENTTFTCCYPITQTQQPLSSVPIGRAIANTQVYLLDPHLQLVPIGVIGEIYTGGDGLARGYHNRPELTHEKFIPNPFNPSQSPRLYRTGDLGRYLADGNIEFVGRFDNQVKIRGFRIELGEIEAALSNHPQIQQAVVIVREDIPENKRLVAYVVAGDQSLNNNQLRGDLKQKLPEYMVPSAFVLLETLPLTPNGKIDRKALPSPDWDTAPTEEYIAPKTQSEQIIANIFAKILGRTVVGTEENFFNLGGHSLLATQLISRLKETFQIEIPLRTVFESPTVAQLEPTITQLRTLGAGLNVPSIQPIAKENEILPLSFAQERLWFLNQLEGSSATYNIPAAIRLVGNLELNALQLALREIVRRHEILRTSFPTVNGKPRQIVNPETTLNIKVIDLQELETTQREKVVGLQLIEEASNPFVLEVSPLIRCSLLQISATEYVLLLTMHHIVSDGWSMGIFIQELSDLYQAFCAVTPSPLAELSIQYADFAVWQRQWLSGEILATQLDYWKQQLQGAPELLQLPTDRTRPSVQTYIGKTYRFSLNQDLTQKLHKLSRESNTTLFMTLLAAIQTLLYRYSGQTDILIGSPIANRHHREIESLIGFFVNTLVLRSQFEDNPSFEQLLKQVRETTLRAYEHQDVPFEQVVEVLQPERSLCYSPLFQVMFVLQNTPTKELELPGITWSRLEQDFPIAKFDLTLNISETSEGLVGGWEYNTDLFDSSTIERMATHFENLLSAIVAHPQQTVAQLPLLSEAERHQLLVEWNNTHSEYPKDKCIHQLFESQVEQTPDAVAVVYEQQQLTYQQLNTQANQLGHYLQSLGVRPEVLVGICVERSVEMVVGLLGILKAGGAYLPLDPNYPAERLSYMLDDSGVELLLTQQELLSSLPSSKAQVVCLDRDWGMIEQQSHSNLSTGTGSDNLAYVIYTSGSTGQPKGTCVIHRGVVRLVKGNSYAEINQTQVFLQLATVSFDASTFEIWGSLLNGAKLVLFPSEQPSLQELGQALKQHQIQTLWLTAGLFHLMVDEGLEDLKSLSQLLAGGDVLSVQHVEKVLSNLKNCQLINGYGPTENTTFTCCYPITQTQQPLSSVPIGRAIANTQVYLLDRHQQLVPIGVIGEIYTGGDGLARGYHNRPSATSEKFIPNPFNPSQSPRLYRTGDLGRYLPDGNIEYIGRFDNQVKIRGFRIELGEIEAALNKHPQVQQAVVIVREDIPGNKRLVAYVVAGDQSLNNNQLRGDLKQKLPEYMVPSAFVLLETLPLTPNGKIDRNALPSPDWDIARDEYIAPRTEVEVILSQIWQELLVPEKVGIHDNFFEIGGDSILSIQVVSRAKILGIQITPRQIFQNQTIAELARVANTTIGVNAQQGIVTGTAPLTPIQHWFFAQNRLEAHHYNQSFLLRLPQNLSNERLALALKKLLLHHDALRLRFTSLAAEYPPIDPRKEESVPLDLVDLSSTPRQEQAEALTKIATVYQASLNLSAGPIMRVVVFNLGQDEQRLLIIIHHLAVDGVSWRIIISDLATIYQQIEAQQPVKLSAKTTAFKDWAVKLKEYAQSEILKQELDYWINQPWSKATPIPLDYAQTQGENTFGSAAAVSMKLSAEETQTLLLSVNEAYNTQINDILLSAIVEVLAEWTGNSTVLIDLEGHGREELFSDVDLSRTVGWFTSLFPVLLKMPEIKQIAEVIKSIKEQLRAIPNRGIGYGIVRYLCEDKAVNEQLQTIPTSEISFNYLGQFDQVQSETSWKFALESTGSSQSLKQKRDHLLDINALVVEGELQIDWTYSSHIYTYATVEKLAQSYIQAIRAIIKHCQSQDAKEYTPSDFPDVQLNQLELDDLLNSIKQGMQNL